MLKNDLFRSFAAKDSHKSLLTKRHYSKCVVLDPHLCSLGTEIPPGTYLKARLIRMLGLHYLEEPMLINCVLVYWCCAILVRGFRCVKQHDSVVWKTHML